MLADARHRPGTMFSFVGKVPGVGRVSTSNVRICFRTNKIQVEMMLKYFVFYELYNHARKNPIISLFEKDIGTPEVLVNFLKNLWLQADLTRWEVSCHVA